LPIRRDQVEGRFPIGQHPAKFAVQVGILRPQASDGVGDSGVLLGPVEPGGGSAGHPLRLSLERPAVEWRVRLLQTIHRNVSAIDPVGAW